MSKIAEGWEAFLTYEVSGSPRARHALNQLVARNSPHWAERPQDDLIAELAPYVWKDAHVGRQV